MVQVLRIPVSNSEDNEKKKGLRLQSGGTLSSSQDTRKVIHNSPSPSQVRQEEEEKQSRDASSTVIEDVVLSGNQPIVDPTTTNVFALDTAVLFRNNDFVVRTERYVNSSQAQLLELRIYNLLRKRIAVQAHIFPNPTTADPRDIISDLRRGPLQIDVPASIAGPEYLSLGTITTTNVLAPNLFSLVLIIDTIRDPSNSIPLGRPPCSTVNSGDTWVRQFNQL